MSIEVGAKLTGKVSGITSFGAFVDLGEHKTGLVHISEVSDGYVKDINDILSVGDEVVVKVMSIGDDGKIGLSIRKAQDKPKKDFKRQDNHHNNHESKRKPHFKNQHENGGNHRRFDAKKKDFDSMLAGFLKESEDRLTSLKRNTEGKRGGRGGRRS